MSCFSQTVTGISANASHFCVNMHQAVSDWTVGGPSKTKESVWQGTAQSKSPNVILRSFVGKADVGWNTYIEQTIIGNALGIWNLAEFNTVHITH